jgi:hypothetical protein
MKLRASSKRLGSGPQLSAEGRSATAEDLVSGITTQLSGETPVDCKPTGATRREEASATECGFGTNQSMDPNGNHVLVIQVANAATVVDPTNPLDARTVREVPTKLDSRNRLIIGRSGGRR